MIFFSGFRKQANIHVCYHQKACLGCFPHLIKLICELVEQILSAGAPHPSPTPPSAGHGQQDSRCCLCPLVPAPGNFCLLAHMMPPVSTWTQPPLPPPLPHTPNDGDAFKVQALPFSGPPPQPNTQTQTSIFERTLTDITHSPASNPNPKCPHFVGETHTLVTTHTLTHNPPLFFVSQIKGERERY